MIPLLVLSSLLIFGVPLPRVYASGSGAVFGYTAQVQASFRGDNAVTAPAPRPDVNIAASPVKVLEMTNFNYEIIGKPSGSPLIGPFPVQQTIFGEPNDPHYHITDPLLVFDSLSNVWIAAIDECTDGPSGQCLTWQLDVAWQSQAYEAFPWHAYHFRSAYTGFDRPIMAVTGDKVIAVGVVNPNQDEYWVINKNQMLNLAPSIDNSTGILTCASGCPAPSLGNIVNVAPAQILSSSNTGYLVGLIPGTLSHPSQVELISVSGPPTALSFSKSYLNISNLGSTSGAIQPQGAPVLNTSPGFVFGGAWYKGHLWLAAETGCTPLGDSQPRTCVRLIQIDTALSTKRQDFNFSIPNAYLFRPAVTIDAFNNLVLAYGYSSPSIYPSVAVVTFPDTTQNSISLANSIKIGSAIAPPDGGANPQRYGDYFSAAVDPADTTKVWVAGEYSDSSLGTCDYGVNFGKGSCWATWIASVKVVGISLAATSQLSASVGTIANTQVTISSLGSFVGAVSLNATTTCNCSNILPVSFNPTSVQLSQGGSNTTTVSLDARNVPAGGYYILQISGQALNLYLTLQVSVYTVYSIACTATASPTLGTRGSVTTQFNVTCSGGSGHYTYLWQFNDGSGATSNLQAPSYFYTCLPGICGATFYPTVTVTDSQYQGLQSTPSVPSVTVYCRSTCPE